MNKIQQNVKRLVSCFEIAVKLRQNDNILDNLRKANCVTKDEYDVITKAKISKYLIKNLNKITVTRGLNKGISRAYYGMKNGMKWNKNFSME